MVQKGARPKLEIDVQSQYHDGDLNSFNIIAEIPGSDLKDEVVMLGGHFDSWHAGTGATDNAIGCGVALEAVRIFKPSKQNRVVQFELLCGRVKNRACTVRALMLKNTLVPCKLLPVEKAEPKSDVGLYTN